MTHYAVMPILYLDLDFEGVETVEVFMTHRAVGNEGT